MNMRTPCKGEGSGLPEGEMERYAFCREGFKCTPFGGEKERDPGTGVVTVEQNEQELRPKEYFAFPRNTSF